MFRFLARRFEFCKWLKGFGRATPAKTGVLPLLIRAVRLSEQYCSALCARLCHAKTPAPQASDLLLALMRMQRYFSRLVEDSLCCLNNAIRQMLGGFADGGNAVCSSFGKK
jgi:hypothetical protein